MRGLLGGSSGDDGGDQPASEKTTEEKTTDATTDDAAASEDDASNDESSSDESTSDDSTSDDSSSEEDSKEASGGKASKGDQEAAVDNLKKFYVAMDEDDYEKACEYVKKDESMGLTDDTCSSTLEQASSSFPDGIGEQIDAVDFKTEPEDDGKIAVTASGAEGMTLYMTEDQKGEYLLDLMETSGAAD